MPINVWFYIADTEFFRGNFGNLSKKLIPKVNNVYFLLCISKFEFIGVQKSLKKSVNIEMKLKGQN